LVGGVINLAHLSGSDNFHIGCQSSVVRRRWS